ncbi:hypothetical protein BDD12DRAFT_558538 [Trichophaea hybrida]|nr:hypothetical protein BDD12DRAFT_558538 [Trichophaea hybrida]
MHNTTFLNPIQCVNGQTRAMHVYNHTSRDRYNQTGLPSDGLRSAGLQAGWGIPLGSYQGNPAFCNLKGDSKGKRPMMLRYAHRLRQTLSGVRTGAARWRLRVESVKLRVKGNFSFYDFLLFFFCRGDWGSRRKGGTTWRQRGLCGHKGLTPLKCRGLGMSWPQAAEYNMITNKQTFTILHHPPPPWI